jgi:hypothetical protein
MYRAELVYFTGPMPMEKKHIANLVKPNSFPGIWLSAVLLYL